MTWALAARVVRSHPVVDFEAPSFWPYIPEIPPYHNAGIWPFVTSYWTWASASAGNTPGVEHGLASLYRAAALFLTNKENMVAQTGHFEGTVTTERDARPDGTGLKTSACLDATASFSSTGTRWGTRSPRYCSRKRDSTALVKWTAASL